MHTSLQAEIANLTAMLQTDEYWIQSGERFVTGRGAIIHKHDKVTVPGGPVTHRPVRSLDSIDCEAAPEDLHADQLKLRLKAQGKAAKLDYWKAKLGIWKSGLAVVGAGINAGDYIINVERMQRAKSGVGSEGTRYRSLPMTVLCDGGANGKGGATTGQYPLRLTLVPGKHLLAHGLPAVTRRLIGSAEHVTAATEAAEAAAEAALLAKQRTPKRGKGKDKDKENTAPVTPAATGASGPAAPDTTSKKQKRKQGLLKRGRGGKDADLAVEVSEKDAREHSQRPRKRHVHWEA